MLVPAACAAFGFGLALWVMVFADILSSNIYNKSFWVASPFLLSTLVVLLYPLVRERLVHREEQYPNR